jgi:hypothetical protein
MKFVSLAVTRQGRMDQLRRDRAAAQLLRTAFPALRHLRIELRFQGLGAPTPQSHVLYPPARAFFEYPCPYFDCDGHFDLTSVVTAAMADSTHRAEGMLECRGSRGRDHTSGRRCLLQLTYEVTATHQQQS